MTYGESESYRGGESESYQGQQHHYGGYQRPDVEEASRYAKQHAGTEDHEDMFSSILSSVVGRDDDDAPHKQPVGEEEAHAAARAHNQIYNENGGRPSSEHSSRDLGSAAAMQAFQMFSSGGSNSGGGSGQLVGLAMGEAMKLMQAQGGGANQGEMLQTAATMAMKLFMTQQSGGGGSGGGLGSIMGLLGGNSGGMAASLLGKLL